jgi:putative phosphoribosyl transferase
MNQFATDIEHSLTIPFGENTLDGTLHVPKGAKGMVLFVHGSGSSRLSSRNQFIARKLNEAKFATLLFDLLTPSEELEDVKTLKYRFDIEFLAARLVAATNWLTQQPIAHGLPIGYFGASTGGGAALVAAAQKPNVVKAVVSRGGRPDLAGNVLPAVKAPTLLIVGGNDHPVIEMNEKALQQLHVTKRLEIIPGATHLFEETGALQQVSTLAQAWFNEYLAFSDSD